MTDETTTPELDQESVLETESSDATPTAAENAGTPEDPNWLPKRLERAKREAVSNFLQSLGLESEEALSARLQEAEDARQAKLTEAERREATIDALTAQLTEKDNTITSLQTQIDAGRIDKSITDAVIEAGIRRPSDALDWSNGSGVEYRKGVLGEDGAITSDGVQAFVESLKEARPDWFGNRQQAGSVANNDALPVDPQQLTKERAAQASRTARRSFN